MVIPMHYDTLEEDQKENLPWLRCPSGYYKLYIAIEIDDAIVDDVMIVGVERNADISRVYLRVTNAVGKKFEEQEIPLGSYDTPGVIRITRVEPTT